MKIVVQKFGGTSLRDEKLRFRAIYHVQQSLAQGYRVVVVVSAMGRTGEPYATDTLLTWIEQNGNGLSSRELDLLLSCGEIISSMTLTSLLNAEGVPAVAFTGMQAGILTDSQFGNAQILSVNPQRILDELEQNKVVTVCGFQGGTEKKEITTLGRGGSDTTATALGGALKADYVDIFTDVNGLMTADPGIVKEASPLTYVTYTEICNLAHQGAKVVHPRAIEVAMQHHLKVRIRSTLLDDPGTLVTSSDEIQRYQKLNDRLITGIAHFPNLTQIKVLAKKDEYDLQLKVFKAMAENKISVDFINVNPTAVIYTVFDEVADQAVSILRSMQYEPIIQNHCAKISIIGARMAGVPGIMAKIIEALMQENISILQSADSHTTIWVLVKKDDMAKAVKVLHRTFHLDKINDPSIRTYRAEGKG